MVHSKEYIIFCVDESILCEIKNNRKIVKNRILSIDSNPEFIGISISDFNKNDEQKIIYKQIFDLRLLSKKSTSKRHYEIFSIAKTIAQLAKHYQCEIIGLEKLTIKSKNHNKGKIFNRKVNNLWNRIKFFNNLKKWLNIYDIKYQEVLPEYSSFIGQLNFPDETDCIAASLEIGRRTNLFNRIFIRKDREKTQIMFPSLEIAFEKNPTLWKKMGILSVPRSWKALFELVKKSKMSYRFLFDSWKSSNDLNFLRHKSYVSNVKVIKSYCFC